MSRTDKDRPWRVKTRDEGVPHHDHSRLGNPIWHRKMFRDADDNPIMETRALYQSAKSIIAKYLEPRKPYDFDWLDRHTHYGYDSEGTYVYVGSNAKFAPREQGKVFEEAYSAVELGNDPKLIRIGTYETQKSEWYIAGYVSDHCTIDEDEPKGSLYRQYPCYMTWTDSPTFRCSCSSCNPGVDYSGLRRSKRDTFKKIVKAVNSGEDDWEDGFDNIDYTPKRRSFQSWW